MKKKERANKKINLKKKKKKEKKKEERTKEKMGRITRYESPNLRPVK